MLAETCLCHLDSSVCQAVWLRCLHTWQMQALCRLALLDLPATCSRVTTKGYIKVTPQAHWVTGYHWHVRELGLVEPVLYCQGESVDES